MQVHNYMEHEVDVILKDLLLSYTNICRCDKCLADIKAIALNRLKPHYVATKKGELYTKINEMDNQFRVDVTKALVEAIKIVEGNPHHE